MYNVKSLWVIRDKETGYSPGQNAYQSEGRAKAALKQMCNGRGIERYEIVEFTEKGSDVE